MTYAEMIRENFPKFKGNEQVMWASVCAMSDMLEQIKDAHSDLYWSFMRKQHVAMFGRHFDKEYAKWQVEQMYHKGDDGKRYEGEHWSIEDTNGVFSKYRGRIHSDYTEWDFYVALNATYHDYCAVLKRINPSGYEAQIIDMAIAFWFMDEDWDGHTKVWDYFSIQNEEMAK